MPIIFRCAIRPTPTIAQEQETIDLVKMENATISAKGRHDPCIVHRARVVQDSLTALALLDLLSVKFGTDWMTQ
jgi:chorismate synthase